jgi:hypothetical protein
MMRKVLLTPEKEVEDIAQRNRLFHNFMQDQRQGVQGYRGHQ